MKLSTVKDLAIVGVVLGGAYAVYKLLAKVPEGLAKAGQAAGGAVYELFHPDAAGSLFFYNVHFAGNERHMIPSKSSQEPDGVDSSGRFTFRGKQFVIRTKVNPQGIREYWAFNP